MIYSGQSLILLLLFAVAAFIVVLSVLRPGPSSIKPGPRPLPAVPKGVMERLRSRLEELYFEKRISIDILKELVGIMEGSPAPRMNIATPLTPPTPLTSQTPLPSKSTPRVAEEKKSTHNIKMLLFSGAAMFTFAAYLFVRTYWTVIPDAFKFLAIVGITVALYATGLKLWKAGRVPKTAETLLLLGITCVFFCVYGFNHLMLHGTLTAGMTSMLGFIAMATVAIVTLAAAPTGLVAGLFGLSVVLAIGSADIAFQWSTPQHLFFQSVGCVGLLSTAVLFSWNAACIRSIRWIINLTAVGVVVTAAAQGFFWAEPDMISPILTFVVLGGVMAIQARLYNTEFAYPAGLAFMAAFAMLLHQLHVPTYRFGLFFIPGAFLAVWRAWTFKQSGRRELGDAYLHLAQLAIGGSLLSVTTIFGPGAPLSYPFAVMILVMGMGAYGALTMLYKTSAYAYASGLTLLYLAGISVFHYDVSLEWSFFVFAAVGMLLAMTRLTPFLHLGIATLSLSLCGIAGRWGSVWLDGGQVLLAPTPSALNAGLAVTALGALGYLFIGRFHRQIAFVYPALASISLFYLFALQKLGLAVDLWHVSWLVPMLMSGFYALQASGRERLARCFVAWAQVASIPLAIGILNTGTPQAFWAAGLMLVSFLPAIWMGRIDYVTMAVLSIYLTHYAWFHQTHPAGQALATYALQLLFVNAAVIFMRAWLTVSQPRINVLPLRIAALFFAAVSLSLSLLDTGIAWRVYLAHGLLGILASIFLYEGRYLGVGTTLFLLAYELFLGHQNVEFREAYSIPAGLYVLAWGYVQRADRGIRDGLYILAQLILYLPSLGLSLSESWELHGIYLGIVSLGVFLFGLHQENRVLTMGGCGMMLTNGVIQSWGVLRAIPRWIYLAATGSLLLGLGALFEFKREWLQQTRSRWNKALSNYE